MQKYCVAIFGVCEDAKRIIMMCNLFMENELKWKLLKTQSDKISERGRE